MAYNWNKIAPQHTYKPNKTSDGNERAKRETCLFEVIIIIVNICFKIENTF